MKKIILLMSFLFACVAGAQNDSVTFKVDMSTYSATTYTTVHLNGTFNNWCGTCNPMSDANNDSIWEVTLPLTAGTIEYKFTLDGWTGQETLTPGLPCTITTGSFTNRVLSFSADTVLPVVCWETCASCVNVGSNQIDLPITWDDPNVNYTTISFGGNSSMRVVDPTDPNNMVLQVDKPMGAQTWSGTTLSTTNGLATPIPFAPGSTIMTARVWSPDSGIIVRLKAEDKTDPTKSVETDAMTTQAGAWEVLTFDFSNQATGTAAINYTYTFDLLSIFFNFGVDGNTAGAKTYYLDNVVFGTGTPAAHNVTFRLDMSQFTGSFTTPEINGQFNNWCGNCNPMTDADNDGIWEVTVSFADSTEYKFSYDNWAGQETLMPGMPCTKTTGTFTNRFVAVTSDTTLPVVCWESCTGCAVSSLEESASAIKVNILPNPNKGAFRLSGDLPSGGVVLLQVTDMQGRIVREINLEASMLTEEVDLDLPQGVFVLSIQGGEYLHSERMMIEN